MKYFPIFLKVSGRRIIVSGGGETAIAKLRLLLKTEANIEVFATETDPQITTWKDQGKLRVFSKELTPDDLKGAIALYAANETASLNTKIMHIANEAGIPVSVVDTPDQCDFITPAIVDRDPLVIAIGTEGAAPVLARKVKAGLEESLPNTVGKLVRSAQSIRPKLAHLSSKKRRNFWSSFYDHAERNGYENALNPLSALDQFQKSPPKQDGSVSVVGIGIGDPEMLTLKARKRIDQADVVIYDHDTAPEIIELARREALIIERNPEKSFSNSEIHKHVLSGAHVVDLRHGNPADHPAHNQEILALENPGLNVEVIAGISVTQHHPAQLGEYWEAAE